MPTWRDLLVRAADRLASQNEARRLVERASGNEGSAYLLGLDDPVPERALPFFDDLLERRAGGEPLQYVLGQWGFRRLDLYLDHRVLIPRPETEMVVQVALAELSALRPSTGRRGARPPTVVDLGTGSGAIALSIALEAPATRVWGTERSAEALAVARANLAGLGTLAGRRVRLAEGSWFDPLPPLLAGHIDLVVSNPPYVADGEVLPPEVQDWEPADALRAGPTGLEDAQTVVKEAPSWLARPGTLVLEIAPHQARDAAAMAHDAGFDEVEVRLDLCGRERILVARWKRQ
ncbi:MAG: peptide chain release factor N(5)-glutamine methyltransferase [Actinobacteria bacterium]|nr:peptide chain release factor N(5)-glutamine methyltransferase [Actinomycetota bacterium]